MQVSCHEHCGREKNQADHPPFFFFFWLAISFCREFFNCLRIASPHVLGREDVPPSPPRPAMIVLPSDERGDTATGQTGADADTRRLDVAEDLSWVPELPPRHTWKRTRLVKAEKVRRTLIC